MATYNPEEFKTKNGKRITFRHCDISDVDTFVMPPRNQQLI
jgi:hypothetical protein